MLVRTKVVQIEVGRDETTSGVLLVPGNGPFETGAIVAHGAGNDMHAPFVSKYSEGLAQAGYPTLKFNFVYANQGRRALDRESLLMQTWLAAYTYLARSPGLNIRSFVAVGKSLGGRIAARMAADRLLPVARLVFLGYPLHSVGDARKLRDEHLYRVRVPMLFFAGTRDPLCNLDKLKGVLNRLHADWDLSIVEGGDHSFHLPKSANLDEEEVVRRIVEKTVKWFRG
jgi:predicted alpha/beta-hydrolase family hydrolase